MTQIRSQPDSGVHPGRGSRQIQRHQHWSSPFAAKRIHLIGIGGCGMCSLAGVLLRCGARISGSDLAEFDAQERLDLADVDEWGLGLRSAPRVWLVSQPNPFHRSTSLHYELPARSRVRLVVHDATGRLVRRLSNCRAQEAGSYQVMWDGTDTNGRDMGPGVYFCHLRTDFFECTHRSLVIR